MTATSSSAEFWRAKKVLVTGHTGFKGSWLSLWLQARGAQVHGLALPPPTTPNLFEASRAGEGMTSTIGDIRDFATVRACLNAFRPEIIIHMAAQPLVRLSYAEPVSTYATNVMGTVHLLEAARMTDSVRAIVNVTTDKCYENREWVWGYRENEPMGGFDPYSNSKGCAELVTSAYRQSFFQHTNVALASARAGNVIGGGDWAADRLVPDILRAFERQTPVTIRYPQSTRPWQHVLEPLSGYLLLAERLFTSGHEYAEGWNFGPDEADARPVRWIVEQLAEQWGHGATWQLDNTEHPHEANHLKLDISKANARLGWRPTWGLATALQKITTWHQAWLNHANVHDLSIAQIGEFETAMKANKS